MKFIIVLFVTSIILTSCGGDNESPLPQSSEVNQNVHTETPSQEEEDLSKLDIATIVEKAKLGVLSVEKALSVVKDRIDNSIKLNEETIDAIVELVLINDDLELSSLANLLVGQTYSEYHEDDLESLNELFSILLENFQDDKSVEEVIIFLKVTSKFLAVKFIDFESENQFPQNNEEIDDFYITLLHLLNDKGEINYEVVKPFYKYMSLRLENNQFISQMYRVILENNLTFPIDASISLRKIFSSQLDYINKYEIEDNYIDKVYVNSAINYGKNIVKLLESLNDDNSYHSNKLNNYIIEVDKVNIFFNHKFSKFSNLTKAEWIESLDKRYELMRSFSDTIKKSYFPENQKIESPKHPYTLIYLSRALISQNLSEILKSIKEIKNYEDWKFYLSAFLSDGQDADKYRMDFERVEYSRFFIELETYQKNTVAKGKKSLRNNIYNDAVLNVVEANNYRYNKNFTFEELMEVKKNPYGLSLSSSSIDNMSLINFCENVLDLTIPEEEGGCPRKIIASGIYTLDTNTRIVARVLDMHPLTLILTRGFDLSLNLFSSGGLWIDTSAHRNEATILQDNFEYKKFKLPFEKVVSSRVIKRNAYFQEVPNLKMCSNARAVAAYFGGYGHPMVECEINETVHTYSFDHDVPYKGKNGQSGLSAGNLKLNIASKISSSSILIVGHSTDGGKGQDGDVREIEEFQFFKGTKWGGIPYKGGMDIINVSRMEAGDGGVGGT